MLGRGSAVLVLLAGFLMTGGQAMAQSSDDLFAQVFGNTAQAEPQNVALPVTVDGRDAGDVGARVDLTAGTAEVNAADLVDVLYRFALLRVKLGERLQEGFVVVVSVGRRLGHGLVVF